MWQDNNDHFTSNFLLNVALKNFENRSVFDWVMALSRVGFFMTHHLAYLKYAVI